MPREKPAYRDNLERISEVYPNKELLSISDVARFTGLCNRVTAKRYPFKKNFISKATFARELS